MSTCAHQWERDSIVDREGMELIVEYFCVICHATMTEREEMDV